MITTKKTFSDLKVSEKKARKDVILEAAEHVFAVKPYNKVTIRDIAREAGISTGSIYRYFSDQQTLFVDVFLRRTQEVRMLTAEIIQKSDGNIEEVTDGYVSYMNEHDNYFRMMTFFMLDGTLSPLLIEKLNDASRQFLDELDKLFRKMGAAEPVRLLSHSFFATLGGVLITFRNYPGRSSESIHDHMKKVAKTIAQKFRI